MLIASGWLKALLALPHNTTARWYLSTRLHHIHSYNNIPKSLYHHFGTRSHITKSTNEPHVRVNAALNVSAILFVALSQKTIHAHALLAGTRRAIDNKTGLSRVCHPNTRAHTRVSDSDKSPAYRVNKLSISAIKARACAQTTPRAFIATCSRVLVCTTVNATCRQKATKDRSSTMTRS